MGAGSLVHGPLSDRFGRRPILLIAIGGYILCALACSFATSFEMLIAMRVAQGLCGAALGVLVTSIIRDQFEGDAMARRMSTIFLVFMAVPIVAPLVGSAVLLFAGWRSIFDLFAIMAVLVFSWVALRLPETLAPENAIPIEPRALGRAWKQVITNRSANCYMLAGGTSQGALFGYLNSSQQIFDRTFSAPDFFPIGFAIIAIGIACANFTNARIVERFGARRVSQTALFAFITLAIAQALAATFAPSSLPLFLGPHHAQHGDDRICRLELLVDRDAALRGDCGISIVLPEFCTHDLGRADRRAIGQQFNGAVTPVALGFLVCGLLALSLILIGERGRLFTRPGTTRHVPL
jgi:DHA1 family bicyclomycin/chloramphenicol resistance-like MFS transporter